jgi:hypothetical protein
MFNRWRWRNIVPLKFWWRWKRFWQILVWDIVVGIERVAYYEEEANQEYRPRPSNKNS